MNDCTTSPTVRKPLSEPLTDRPQVIPARRARGMVRRAAYVGVYVTTGPNGAADILDTSKARVLRMLARRDRVWVSELFGTVIVGRPEPIPAPCIRCYPEADPNDADAIDLRQP